MKKVIAILAPVLCMAFFGGLAIAYDEAPTKELEKNLFPAN